MLVDETKPLVVGDWLRYKDITLWLPDNLYHNEIGAPHAWTAAVVCIVPGSFGLEAVAHVYC